MSLSEDRLLVEVAAHIMIEVKIIFDQLKASRGSI